MKESEEWFLRFSLACRDYLKSQKWDEVDRVYKVQLTRSSSSVGANYIEANENLGKQDMLMHLKISRKEAKESQFWLQHLGITGLLSTINFGRKQKKSKKFSPLLF